MGEEGEQGGGGGGGEAAAESTGRTPCRGGTTPAKQSQEIPAPPNWSSEWGAGGAPASMSGGVPPLIAPAKNRTLTPKMQHLQSSPHSTQQARCYFLISIFQRKKRRLRLVQLKVQGCSLIPVPSPGFCHCPRGWAHSGVQGWHENRCALKGHSWPVQYSPGQGKAGWDSRILLGSSSCPYKHPSA